MPDPHHTHLPHFLTRPIEELTPDNDPQAFASFQRALSKWKARCAIDEAARLSSFQSDSTNDGGEAAERFERFA